MTHQFRRVRRSFAQRTWSTTRSARKQLVGVGLACSVLAVGGVRPLSAQTTSTTPTSATSTRRITVRRISAPIVVDGNVDAAEWAGTDEGRDFTQIFPADTSRSITQTEFRLAYDDRNLYVAAIMHDELPGDYVSPSLRRDYRGSANDGVTLVLDPWRDKTTGVFFGVNPYNVQREGLVVNGGTQTEDFDRSWDNVWTSATQRTDSSWSVEMAIPFNALRFRPGDASWNVNFYRIDSKQNERAIWNPVPRQYQLYSLAYLGEMLWDTPLTSGGAGVTLIPYIAGDGQRDFVAGTDFAGSAAAGLDAKVALTPSLNLDLTINPDFSQVEVDEQQTNLDRFELFFPERRQFFLENADLFAGFGVDNARPFFSRRIGVAIDSSTGQNVQNRITAGARISGRLNDDWRVGLLSMQAAADEGRGVDARNYAVLAVQRQLFARSNLGLIAVNQQNTSGGPLDRSRPGDGSASRLLGADYNLASADNAWTGKFFYHQSFSEGEDESAYSHGASLQRNTLRWRATWEHQLVGAGFDARTGFVPRRGFQRAAPSGEISLFPIGGPVNRHNLRLSGDLTWDQDWGLSDRTVFAKWTAEMRNTSRYELTARSRFVRLYRPFSPTRGGAMFAAGEHFEQPEVELSTTTDPRRTLSGTARVRVGKFFNGTLQQTSGDVNYRWRQYFTSAFTWSVSQVNLAEGYDDATIWLAGSRFDVTMSTTLFWTTFTQYNSQFDNVNLNSRLQWRFLPASDFFLVYTDNYLPDGFRAKNRALLAKVSWWINM